MMRKRITTMIRPELEYPEVVWLPHKKHKKKMERIQRLATKLVPELEKLIYEERLKEIQSVTLEERRERGRVNIITICKLINQMESR